LPSRQNVKKYYKIGKSGKNMVIEFGSLKKSDRHWQVRAQRNKKGESGNGKLDVGI
jgi:SLT domain-containing protein